MKTVKDNKFLFGIVATFFVFFLFVILFSRIVRAAVPEAIKAQPRVAIVAIAPDRIINQSILVDRVPVIDVTRSIVG